jgi:hypothetical protein
MDTGPFVCQSLKNNDALKIMTTKGNYVCQITIKHTSAYIQGEEVLITMKDGKTVIYSVRGSYKRVI